MDNLQKLARDITALYLRRMKIFLHWAEIADPENERIVKDQVWELLKDTLENASELWDDVVNSAIIMAEGDESKTYKILDKCEEIVSKEITDFISHD